MNKCLIKIVLGWLVFITVQSCDSGKNEFVIEGVFNNSSHLQTAVLYEGERKLDSAFLTENGKFRIRRTASHPRLFTLVAGKDRFPLILENGQTVTVEADLSEENPDYTVRGSALSEKIKGLYHIQNERNKFEDALDYEFLALSKGLDEQALLVMRNDFIQRYRVYMEDYTTKIVAFAEANPDLAGFYAMSTLDREVAEAELIAYAEQIEGKYDDNAVVRLFLEEINHIKRLAVGQPAPLFESLTANNRTVKLSDYQGKYTLVDFWASWCMPCREENPNIVKLYHQYKDRGFDVFGVSLDSNPGSWLRAIEEDQLQWTNVSDLQAWGSEVVGLYSIKAIPTSYILDPEGIIVAKNLRGEELEAFLKKTFD